VDLSFTLKGFFSGKNELIVVFAMWWLQSKPAKFPEYDLVINLLNQWQSVTSPEKFSCMTGQVTDNQKTAQTQKPVPV
jgi:hypothetical protein